MMTVRQADRDDFRALADLARITYSAAFGHTFNPSDLDFHLRNNLSDAYFLQAVVDDIILIAEAENRLIGFVQFGPVRLSIVTPSPRDQELRRLYVRPDYQNRGLGRQLIEAALEHPWLKGAENIYLDVWEHNRGAGRFYERFGFQVIGAHQLAVASGVAAHRDLIMVRRQS